MCAVSELTGTFSQHDHFRYIREKMPQLEAVNMRELRLKDQCMFYWEGDGTAGNGWGEHPVGRPRYDDDALPMDAFNSMKYLQVAILPENLRGIGDEAFAGCGNIFEIKIGSKKAVAASENIFSNDAYTNAERQV